MITLTVAGLVGCSGTDDALDLPPATTTTTTTTTTTPPVLATIAPVTAPPDPSDGRCDETADLDFPVPRYESAAVPRPADHERAGIAAGEAVRDDQIGLIIGMSNTHIVANRYAKDVDGFTFLNGARGGADVERWAEGTQWKSLVREIQEAGHGPSDVGVVWMLHSLRGGAEPRVGDLCRSLQHIIEQLVVEFPDLRQIYISDRGYGGWTENIAEDGTPRNGEPGTYSESVAIDTVVEFNRDRDDVWVGWGPYMWANGDDARADGLTWPRDMFKPDGVHYTAAGGAQYVEVLDAFFEGDATSPWYRRR